MRIGSTAYPSCQGVWRRPRSGGPAARAIAILAVVLLPIAGCTSLPLQSTERQPGFGDSVNQNAAVMIIDPRPVRAEVTALDLDGHRVRLAILRYYTNTVIPPQTPTTSGLGSALANGSAPAGVATDQAMQ
jgi:hypothetical protein